MALPEDLVLLEEEDLNMEVAAVAVILVAVVVLHRLNVILGI